MKRHHGQGNLLKKDLNCGLQLQRVIVHDHHDKEQASRYSWCKSSSWELISWTGQADINGTRELISFSTITRLKEANWEWCGDIKNQSDTLPTRVHLLILSLIVPPVVDQASIRTHGPMGGYPYSNHHSNVYVSRWIVNWKILQMHFCELDFMTTLRIVIFSWT